MNGKLIVDNAASGSWNMAKDQALADYSNDSGDWILRIYEWSQPTLSIGYFQQMVDRTLLEKIQWLPVVRRATGGGAIIHDDEITYSIAIPKSTSKGADPALYSRIHQALISKIQELGWNAQFASAAWGETGESCCAASQREFLCFNRRSEYDVVIDGAKVIGSAQRHHRNALLQHGSILLKRSLYAPTLSGILDLQQMDQDRTLPWDWKGIIAETIMESLAAYCQSQHQDSLRWFRSDPIDEDEIQKCVEDRFGNSAWNDKR